MPAAVATDHRGAGGLGVYPVHGLGGQDGAEVHTQPESDEREGQQHRPKAKALDGSDGDHHQQQNIEDVHGEGSPVYRARCVAESCFTAG